MVEQADALECPLMHKLCSRHAQKMRTRMISAQNFKQHEMKQRKEEELNKFSCIKLDSYIEDLKTVEEHTKVTSHLLTQTSENSRFILGTYKP